MGASGRHKTKQAALTALSACLIVLCLLLALAFQSVFLQQPLTVLNRQTSQGVCAIKQSIFKYDVYDLNSIGNQGDQMFLLKNCPKTMKNHPKSRPTMFLLDLLYKTVLWCFLFDFMLISNGTGHSFIVFFVHKRGDKFF
jgi:hypothetical protein